MAKKTRKCINIIIAISYLSCTQNNSLGQYDLILFFLYIRTIFKLIK